LAFTLAQQAGPSSQQQQDIHSWECNGLLLLLMLLLLLLGRRWRMAHGGGVAGVWAAHHAGHGEGGVPDH
jgi:MYXO-CTERM domain-containing protein